MQEQERWLPVVGWEGFYEVSDLGRVRSVSRIAVRNGKSYEMPGRVLQPLRNGKRLGVSLCGKGKPVRRMIHQLVLEAFKGLCPEGQEACHYDDDSSNNRLSNLRWDTHPANEEDKKRNGNHWPSNQTHCKWGHEFTPENTRITKRGTRECITCQRQRVNEYMKKRRAEIKKDAGLCGQCGKPRESERYKLCRDCREVVRERSRQERAKRRAEKRCFRCGKPRDSNFFKLCTPCRELQVSQYHERKNNSL